VPQDLCDESRGSRAHWHDCVSAACAGDKDPYGPLVLLQLEGSPYSELAGARKELEHDRKHRDPAKMVQLYDADGGGVIDHEESETLAATEKHAQKLTRHKSYDPSYDLCDDGSIAAECQRR
jgi:hypothetical protein